MGSIRTNTQYDQIRKNLEARNLYNPNDPYTINNNNIVKAVNSIAGLIPGKSIDITNTVIGRVFLTNQTPIMTIGLQQYSKHLAQSVTSYGISDAMPSANLLNLFDGDPTTKLFTKKEDYRITRDETKSSIGKIIQDITNQSPKLSNTVFTNRGNLAPFDKLPNQYDYIRNTGKGQLNQYYGSIGNNLYIQSTSDFIEVAKDQGYKINKVTKALLNKSFFPTDDPNNFPDGQAASDDVRSEIVWLREETVDKGISEYGSNEQTTAMGSTKKENYFADQYDFEFNGDAFGFSENNDNQIVWGRDDTSTLKSKFGVRSGALLYTKGLLQARGSRAYFDQTKKSYTARNGSYMYNGSPLTTEVDGTPNDKRQSTINDPYNNFAKAIRFNGNNVYGAPAESVINKTVIPKFHPTLNDSGTVDRNNMMFSIENLAYILNDKGYLGDSLGTKVPKSEVGVNRGRLMWFAPYDVEVSETASAKYETTQFIGRSEPIYSYQTSERSARLSFKLIIDYPPQVEGRTHGDSSKFFAFGDVGENKLKNIDIDKERESLLKDKEELSKIQPTEELIQPNNIVIGERSKFYFDNDQDDVEAELDRFYELGVNDPAFAVDYGYNSKFETSIENDANILATADAFQSYTLTFVGRASKLYNVPAKEQAYNTALGLRRANSLKDYLEYKFKEKTGFDFRFAGIKVDVITSGSTNGSDIGAKSANINNPEVKKERNAYVVFGNSGFVQKKIKNLTVQEIERKKILEEQIRAKEELINAAIKVQSDERIFTPLNDKDRILRGFEAIKKITLSPVFHSQTPEDFHRRLTFLHQCTRQGNSIINSKTESAGISTPTNSVFGRPPICILRLGDMFHSKVIIETVDFDYSESIWDVNPEGMGMQFMIADISMNLKIIGGQSLKGAIDVIQNAESFNYYANSTFYNNDVYRYARKVESAQIEGDSTLINAKGQARFGSNTTGDAGGDFVPLPASPAV